MVSLVFGTSEITQSFNFVLETDLANPINGPPGLVTLKRNEETMKSYFIGFTSPKHNIQKYLQAVQLCFHHWRASFCDQTLLVHCHNWKSGIGKTMLSDIIRITQPSYIVEYFTETPEVNSILREKSSLLEGIYHISPSKVETFQVPENQKSDIKSERGKILEKYFGKTGFDLPHSYIDKQPWVCFFNDVGITVNQTPIEARYISALVPKICGLSIKADPIPECKGLGIIRDVNTETGMLYIVTPITNIHEIDTLEICSGEGSLELERDALWSNQFYDEFEEDIGCVLHNVILAETQQKYHPGRKN